MSSDLRCPAVRYVILFPGRTGSTYLTDHMASHPEIVAHYEILAAKEESWIHQQEFLDDLVETKRRPEISAVGFKTKLRNICDQTAFEAYLKQRQFRIIHLTRTNQLKFVVSIVRAKLLREQEGTSNLIHNRHQPLGPTAIPLADFAKAKTRLRRHNRIAQVIDRLQLPTLEFTYEDLVNDEQSALKRVWDFLDVRNIVTTGRTRKNTPHDIRKAVTNLDEIIDHYPEMARFVDQV